MAYTIDIDELYPRDAEHRYRLYARRGKELEVLVTAPSMAGIGTAIGQLHEDEKEHGRRLADCGAIGILDVMTGGPRGEWIVPPWHRKEQS